MSLSDELLADFEDEGMNVDGTESRILPTIAESEMETNDTDGQALGYEESVRSVAKLYGSQKLNAVMENIKKFSSVKRGLVSGPVESDPEYQIIVEANQITVNITEELGKYLVTGLYCNAGRPCSSVFDQLGICGLLK